MFADSRINFSAIPIMVYIAANRVIKAVYLLASLEGANAFWRLECDGSVGLARIDPLMDYGRAADHVHTIKGGSGKTFITFVWFQDNCCLYQIYVKLMR